MDVTEVTVSPLNYGKKRKNKTPKKKRSGNGEGSGAERKVEEEEDEKKMENSEGAYPPNFSVSEIKNKQRRHVMFMKIKQEKRKVKTEPHGGQAVQVTLELCRHRDMVLRLCSSSTFILTICSSST